MNGLGLGGDPFLQGLVVYSKIIKQEKVRYPALALADNLGLRRFKQYLGFVSRSNLPVVSSSSLCRKTEPVSVAV